MPRKSLFGVLQNCSLGDPDSGKRSVGRDSGAMRTEVSRLLKSCGENSNCDTSEEIFDFKEEAVLSYWRVRV